MNSSPRPMAVWLTSPSTATPVWAVPAPTAANSWSSTSPRKKSSAPSTSATASVRTCRSSVRRRPALCHHRTRQSHHHHRSQNAQDRRLHPHRPAGEPHAGALPRWPSRLHRQRRPRHRLRARHPSTQGSSHHPHLAATPSASPSRPTTSGSSPPTRPRHASPPSTLRPTRSRTGFRLKPSPTAPRPRSTAATCWRPCPARAKSR